MSRSTSTSTTAARTIERTLLDLFTLNRLQAEPADRELREVHAYYRVQRTKALEATRENIKAYAERTSALIPVRASKKRERSVAERAATTHEQRLREKTFSDLDNVPQADSGRLSPSRSLVSARTHLFHSPHHISIKNPVCRRACFVLTACK